MGRALGNNATLGRPRRSDTTAFLVVKGDQLLYEGYFQGPAASSTQTSFSVAKSFGSALIGVAIDQGYIHGVDDPITRYLPEVCERARAGPGDDPPPADDVFGFNHGTGSGGSPLGDDARTYYDPNLRAYARIDLLSVPIPTSC